MIDYQKELNAEQLAVVEHGDGPCLVLAGAGSGKTRTIVYRVAYLIERGVDPEHILLLTFTNKAAEEMMARIDNLMGAKKIVRGTRVWGGTFHSIANRLLRQYAETIGFTDRFVILDEDDSHSLIKAVIRELGIDTGGKRFPSPAVIKDIVGYATNSLQPLSDVVAARYEKFALITDDVLRVAEGYRKKKIASNAMDFDDLLTHFYAVLQKDPQILAVLRKKFHHVLVDEYQDTNPLQAALIETLTGGVGNVLVVGDDAQSIYSFRAATIRNILDFPQHFKDTKIYTLETNYRSTPEIIDVANEVIAQNTDQYKKQLRSVCPSLAKPVVVPTRSATNEAEWIIERIDALLAEGETKDIAVLFRATHHSQMLEFALMRRGIAYEYRGGLRFFDRSHVKDVLAFLRVHENIHDESAWLRLLRMQTGVGDVAAAKIMQAVHAQSEFADVMSESPDAIASGRAIAGWRNLRKILEQVFTNTVGVAGQIRAIIQSGYREYLDAEFPNSHERVDDVLQLAVFAESYTAVKDFLADITLNDAIRAPRGRASSVGAKNVVLSTVHQAKGLEWDVVFVMHLTGSGFPNRRAMMEEKGLEEERRLFYVAVTRARRQLFLTYPVTSQTDGFTYEQPSMFLEEISPSSVEWPKEKHEEALEINAGYEEPSIDVVRDGAGEMRAVAGRMRGVQADWRKKSFLREVEE